MFGQRMKYIRTTFNETSRVTKETTRADSLKILKKDDTFLYKILFDERGEAYANDFEWKSTNPYARSLNQDKKMIHDWPYDDRYTGNLTLYLFSKNLDSWSKNPRIAKYDVIKDLKEECYISINCNRIWTGRFKKYSNREKLYYVIEDETSNDPVYHYKFDFIDEKLDGIYYKDGRKAIAVNGGYKVKRVLNKEWIAVVNGKIIESSSKGYEAEFKSAFKQWLQKSFIAHNLHNYSVDDVYVNLGGVVKKDIRIKQKLISNDKKVISGINIYLYNNLQKMDDDEVYNLEYFVNLFISDLRSFIKAAFLSNINYFSSYEKVCIECSPSEILDRFGVLNNFYNELNGQNISATFQEMEGNSLARAFGTNSDRNVKIQVNPNVWSVTDLATKFYILYHELGHDILNLEHGQGGKMMFNYPTGKITWDKFFMDRNKMFYNYLHKKYPKIFWINFWEDHDYKYTIFKNLR